MRKKKAMKPTLESNVNRLAFACALAWATLGCTAKLAGPIGSEQQVGGSNQGSSSQGGSAGNGNTVPDGTPASAVGPGRVAMHRLNVNEYNNTVRDLLATSIRLSDNFPPDDTAYGFDNVASALNMTEVALGYYVDAAKQLASEALSPQHRASIVPCDVASGKEACVTTVLGNFLPRAWRRPAEAGDIERLVALFSANKGSGATDDEALERVLRAALLAPQFLFRIERNSGVAGIRALDGYELAARLSYFLWSTMPDSELSATAANGSLQDPGTLEAQVTRLLTDGKAAAFTENFGSQWLPVRSLENARPDATQYPAFDEPLRAAMRAETMGLFADIASGRRPFSELLNATSGYVNARLAQHYGMSTVTSAESAYVALPAGRGGLLTQASLLTVLAHPQESAPVKRGQWILAQLLCQEPPPPPPDVPQEPAPQTGQSRRERLAAHRIEPVCKSCHDLMDPLGLALENYDGIGAYRTTENGVAIDPAGQLTDGSTFTTPAQLEQLIAANPALPRCIAQKVFTYGVGRAPREGSASDAAQLDGLAKAFNDAGQLFPKLVAAVVHSEAFTKREDEASPL